MNTIITSENVSAGLNAAGALRARVAIVAFLDQLARYRGGIGVLGDTLTQNSDRTTKADIQAVDPQAVLAEMAELPISTWRKIGDTSTHLGPMAQDFRAAFGLGNDDRHLAPGDLAGVSLAAIQRLHALVEEQRQVIGKQHELIVQLEERLRRLEAQEHLNRSSASTRGKVP